MVELTNAKEIQKSLEREARLNTQAGEIIKDLKNDIQPTLQVNPLRSINVVESSGGSTSGTVTVYTTPTDRDFYLIGAHINIFHDAASTGTVNSFRVSIGGDMKTLMSFRKPSLTLFQFSENIEYVTPIKIDRGGTLELTGTFGAGVSTKNLSIRGFTIDP